MESKSDYEQQRDKNIEANNAVLRSLGLLVEKEKHESTAASVPKRKKEEDVLVLPSRKSARLNNVQVVHQEVYYSSDEDDGSYSRKRNKKKAKDAPSLKDVVPSRQSKRRSQPIFPQVNVDDEDSDDEFDNIVFNVTDGYAGHAEDDTDAHVPSPFDFDPYGFDTSDAFRLANDGATMPDAADDPDDRPLFVSTMFFMDNGTVLCPQV